MKKFFGVKIFWSVTVWVLLSLFFAGEAAPAKSRVVRVGVFPAAPLVVLLQQQQQQQQHRPDGMFIDLIEHFAESFAWEIEYVEKSWSELLLDLEQGKIDLLPAIGYTEERAAKYDFSKHPVFIDSGVLFTGAHFTLHTVFDLQGKRVAAVKGSLFTTGFLEYIKSFGIHCKMVFTSDNRDVMQAIVSGEVEAGVTIYSLGNELLQEFPVQMSAISFSPVALGFAVKKGQNGDLLAAIDQMMELMVHDPDSLYSRAYKKWMVNQGKKEIPPWVWWGVLGLVVCAIVLVAWNSFLKRQVNLKTRHLQLEIADRKRAFHALSAEKELLAVTLRSIGDGVITTDHQGKIVMLNKIAEELTGWPLASAVGCSLSEVFHTIYASTREACDNSLEKILKTAAIVEESEDTLLLSRDGREIVIAKSGAPIRNQQGQVVGAVVAIRDITEKQKLLESAKRADRLESIGILAGGIAHDFNNLLTGLYGNLEMARMENSLPRAAESYLDKALRSFNRAQNLTQQLLTFSKGGAPLRKIASIKTIIKESAQFALSGSKVSCDFQLADDLGHSNFDENQIWQVLDNLYINAVQAMPSGGRITVTANNISKKADDAHLRSTSLREGRYLKISIADKGVGIPANIIAHIFDPFFTTKKQGNGLGLATAYSIIKKHEGDICVESAVGQGTTFHLFLPMVAATTTSTTATALAKNREPSLHRGTGTILIMDDEEEIRLMLAEMLKMMGYQVEYAGNGEEVLKKIASSHQNFVAIFMDLTIIDGMGGLETITLLRKNHPQLLAFVASGYSSDPVMANPKAYGFSDKLQKPFRTSELSSLLSLYFPC
ncbi:MAG: transporter substrate-binding domain-containing protein [Oligoflexia bacterium]|nr:transporter substrate-binding domain-containing protein [Oligoflexia bacterium]